MMGVRTLAVVLLAAAACTDGPPGGGGPSGTSHVETLDIPGMYPRQLDVLFVVDDTTAMAPYASALSGLGTSLETALEAQTGTLPDTRIAVTTTDATSGALRVPSGLTEPFLATALAPDFTRTTNFSGALATAVDSLLAVGASRSSANAPLAATPAALDGNASFLRGGYGSLAVVTVTASDDASSATVASYASALKARMADPSDVVAIGVYDVPATRLDEFHQQFPYRNTVSAIDGARRTVHARASRPRSRSCRTAVRLRARDVLHRRRYRTASAVQRWRPRALLRGGARFDELPGAGLRRLHDSRLPRSVPPAGLRRVRHAGRELNRQSLCRTAQQGECGRS
jgi:hypothetical protein